MKCPFCEGIGEFYDSVLDYHDLAEDCSLCGGEGKIGFKVWLHYHLVNFLDWLLLP